MSIVRIGGAGKRRNIMTVSYATENSSFFRCALKVVMAVELIVAQDIELQTTGAMVLNVLDWKLILVY